MGKPFWDKKWGRNAICPISQSRLRPGKNIYGVSYTIRLPCKHRFYRSALVKWVSTMSSRQNGIASCPLCRKNIYLIDLLTHRS